MLILSAVVLVAGVAAVLFQLVSSRSGAQEPSGDRAARHAAQAAARTSPHRAARATGDAPGAAASDDPAAHRKALYQAAVAQLTALTRSPSPRIKRLAAQALARTGDKAALAQLRSLLTSEPSLLGRIQIAYALARAGDAQAREFLRTQLEASRRDARLDAARSLVQLGDDSGRKALHAMLPLVGHRVGAAGLLARLGDPDGVKALHDELTSHRASTEVKMRAAVALGRAGDASVKDKLRDILADRRYKVGAADALAALGDPAAIEPLTAQLGLTAMRVQAALWLRRLHKTVDLAPLEVAMDNADEAARVSAAEALIILTGPVALAEHD